MISDIQSMLNASTGKQSNVSNSTNNTLGNAGTLAKLSSEIKLIENLSLIKFQGSEALNFQGKPVQLLHATSSQQPFTLINTGTPISIGDITNAQLDKITPSQVRLTIPTDSLSRQSTAPSQSVTTNQTTLQTKPIETLTLASRVMNLTVVSTPTAETTKTSPPANQSQLPNTQVSKVQTGNSTLAINTPTNTQVNSQSNTQAITPNTIKVGAQTVNPPIESNAPSKSQIITVTDGKNEFPIISQGGLKKGDVIRVFIDANNNVQALPPKTNTALVTTTLQMDALKQSLPKQLSFGDMSQLVKQLHSMNETSPSTLPPQTQQALKQLVQHLPNLAALTSSPDAMKQAIQTSGLFSESLLLNDNKIQLPADLKINLERLKDAQESAGALRLGNTVGNNLPTEQIANAIERITTNQLRHMNDSTQLGTPTYPLHIELPIKDGQSHHLTQIEINQDTSTKDNQQQDRRWLVKLKFDFEETGRFDARASIQANKVGILFAAENPDTVQKLQKKLPILKQQLKDKDIDVERLDTFQAKLEREDKNDTFKTHALIDVRT